MLCCAALCDTIDERELVKPSPALSAPSSGTRANGGNRDDDEDGERVGSEELPATKT